MELAQGRAKGRSWVQTPLDSFSFFVLAQSVCCDRGGVCLKVLRIGLWEKGLFYFLSRLVDRGRRLYEAGRDVGARIGGGDGW